MLARKLSVILLGAVMALTLVACGNSHTGEVSESQTSIEAVDDTIAEINTSAINISPDKYTWYIKNYVGRNCASIGYTAMNGKRMDRYGESVVELVFVTQDGSYIDIESEDVLKEYSVIKQNIEPNTVLKLVFDKDSKGNEYDSLVESQSIEEVVLCVKKNGSKQQKDIELTAIKLSPDKYTWYIADYVGRNLANCGYTSMGGDLMHKYGEGVVKLSIVADDGSFVDPNDFESLRNYVVTGQSLAPNTELKLVFDKNSNGVEYDRLVESQNIEEIELYVKRITSEALTTKSVTEITTEATTAPTTTKPTTPENENALSADFKAAMDSYEEFMDEYVAFMKKYESNPSDISLIMDYATYMSKYADAMQDFEEWEDEDMNDAELAYYIDVQARVSKKLLEVG